MVTLVWAAWILLQAVSPSPGPGPSALMAAAGFDAGQDFTIKSSVMLVSVDAIVRNNKGGFVGGLKAEDFVIYDNGVVQPTTYFSHEQLPLAVALVVDRSPSIQRYLPQLRGAALMALQRLKPEDQVALFGFDMESARFSDLTEEHARIAQLIGKIPGGIGTNIYDVLYEAAQYLQAHALDRRRAIILVSDNYQSVGSNNSPKQTLQEMLEASATLYSIRVPGDNPGLSSGDPSGIGRFARETGGEILNAVQAVKLPEVLDAAILNLKQGYTLGFVPSSFGEDGSYHRLEVKLDPYVPCPGCRVQARAGYYAGTPPAPPPPGNISRASKKAGRGQEKPAVDLENPAARGRAGMRSLPPREELDELLAQNRIRMAQSENSELHDISFEIGTAEVKDEKGQAQIRVDVKIDSSNVLFKLVDERYTGKLRITTFYQDSAGRILAADWKIMEMRLYEWTYKQVLASGIPFTTTIPMRERKQRIKVVIFEPGTGKVGSRLVKLQ